MINISTKFKKGILNMRIKGNLTSDTISILESEFIKITKKSGCKYILLNLNDVSIIDKEGINMIKKCYEKVLKNNGKFIIYGMDTLFFSEVNNNENLYQISEEETAYKIIKL